MCYFVGFCFVEFLTSERVEMAIASLRNRVSKGMVVERARCWRRGSEELQGSRDEAKMPSRCQVGRVRCAGLAGGQRGPGRGLSKGMARLKLQFRRFTLRAV